MIYDKYQLSIGRDWLFDLMFRKDLKVKTKRPGHRTTDSRHTYEVYPNKIKDLAINHAEQVFVSDITYIRVSDFFMYLFLVTDIYSKKIMGYHLGESLHRNHAVKALKNAIKNRQYFDQKIFHHSDCGGQYCSNDYTRLLVKNNFTISMTEKDHCYENSIAERVNGILKGELILNDVLPTKAVAKSTIRKAVEIYNEIRTHLSCGLLTPFEAHKKGEGLKKMWSKKTYTK